MLGRNRLFAAALDAEANAERVVSLAASVRLCDFESVAGHRRPKPGTDEELLEVGGLWDRREKAWLGNATEHRVFRLHRGQEEAARWFCEWLEHFVAGDWGDMKRAHSSLWVGARRSGKTHLAAVAAVLVSIAKPRQVVWVVSPTLDRSDEIDVAMRELMPRAWYKRREIATGKSTVFRLANGSRILLRSGAKPESLRSGRCDLAIYNEAQAQAERGYVNLRGAVADRGSLVIVCANPPETLAGLYVETLWTKVQHGEVDGTAFHFDARKNPMVDQASLAAMESEVDEKTAARDLYGVIGVPIGDVVFHAWAPDNLREPELEMRDITARVTKRELGRAAGYVAGIDLQRTPACVAAMFKIFESPAFPGEEIAFVVDEFEGHDENDLIDAIEASARWQPDGRVDGDTYRGWRESSDSADHPVHVAAVLDASAWFQDSEHNTGKTSDRAFLARRWRDLFKPIKDSDKNPDLISRFKVCNARLCNAARDELGTPRKIRRLFVSPRCKETAAAMRLYPNRHGKADRTNEHAHRADTVSYVTFRMWGAVKIHSGKPEYLSLGKHEDRSFPGWDPAAHRDEHPAAAARRKRGEW